MHIGWSISEFFYSLILLSPPQKIDLQSGCVRNMALQRSGLHGNRPTTSVDIKGSFKGAKSTTILSFQWLYTKEKTSLWKLKFHFCLSILSNPTHRTFNSDKDGSCDMLKIGVDWYGFFRADSDLNYLKLRRLKNNIWVWYSFAVNI